jgi:hypothetical protein
MMRRMLAQEVYDAKQNKSNEDLNVKKDDTNQKDIVEQYKNIILNILATSGKLNPAYILNK